MKRFSILFILLLVCLCTACSRNLVPPSISPAPTTNITNEPTISPTDHCPVIPSLDPVLTESSYIRLNENKPLYIDIDGDMNDDIIQLNCLLENIDGIDEYNYNLTIHSSFTNLDYTYDFKDISYAFGIVSDFNLEDNVKEVIISYDEASDDYVTMSFRWNQSKKEFDIDMKNDICISPLFVNSTIDINTFNIEEGILMTTRTDILGTSIIYGHFIINDENKIEIINDFYWPVLDSIDPKITLNQDFTITLLDGTEYVVKAGEWIIPQSTNNQTYVIVGTSNGAGKINIEIKNTETEYGIYLNGILQDDLAEIHYAD